MKHPHQVAPLTLYGDHLPARATLVDVRANAARHEVSGLNVCDFLCEPKDQAGQEWAASVVRRVIGASTGPIAIGVEGPAAERLEAAGWFVAAKDTNLGAARDHCWPALGVLRRLQVGFGCPRPTLVLVGDRTPRNGQLPFASKGGSWLFRALRALGHDELTIYLANSRSVSGEGMHLQLAQLRDAVPEAQFVGLGRAAQGVLRKAKVRHAEVCSPSYHMQYKHAEGVEGYADRFASEGVKQLVGADECRRTFYTHPVTSIPELREPYSIRDLSGNSLPKGTRAPAGQRACMDPVKRETAHRAFVTGVAKTVQEAATLAGAHYEGVRRVSKAEDWRAERDAHQRQITENAKAAQVKLVADRQAKVTRGQWALLEVAQGKLARRMKDDDVVIGPRDVEALARTALGLSGAGYLDQAEAVLGLSSVPLIDLARQAIEQIEKGLGGK